MSFRVRSNNMIFLTRGDTFKAVLTITYPDGSIYTPIEGDRIRFALKKDIDDEECLIWNDMGMYDGCASLSGSLSLQIVTGEGADYNKLTNLPTINGIVVKGDLTTQDLGIERGYDANIDPEDDEHIILTT